MTGFAFPFAAPFGSGFSFVPGPGGAGGTPLSLLDATPAGGLAGQLDQLIDPGTLDYVRTADGEWAETADTRTTMLLMIDIEFGASPFDPQDGTTIGALRRSGDPITPELVQAETLRAGGILQAAGLISDLVVAVRDPATGKVLVDQSNRPLVHTVWRDLASGSPVDLVLQPG